MADGRERQPLPLPVLGGEAASSALLPLVTFQGGGKAWWEGGREQEEDREWRGNWRRISNCRRERMERGGKGRGEMGQNRREWDGRGGGGNRRNRRQWRGQCGSGRGRGLWLFQRRGRHQRGRMGKEYPVVRFGSAVVWAEEAEGREGPSAR